MFGRIDRHAEQPGGTESFHIGRLAVADENSRADRRRLAGAGRRAVLPRHRPRADGPRSAAATSPSRAAPCSASRTSCSARATSASATTRGSPTTTAPGAGLRGYSTLLAALERGRTGTLGDIVATIQAEQDEIIRSPQAGVLVVQGGPGTGKTVVALHRAAYLLYTHRFPLEDQGVLVIGPNRVFLRYIERVLPSLGEAGVEQVVLADLVPDVALRRRRRRGRRAGGDAPGQGRRPHVDVIDKAVGDRERPLRDDLVVPFRTGYVRLTVEESARIVKAAAPPVPPPQRRPAFRRGRGLRRPGRLVARRATSRPASCARRCAACPRCGPRSSGCGRCSRPAQLLHDLFGSPALLRLAARNVFDDAEIAAAVPAPVRRRRRRPLDRRRRRPARRRPRGARPGAGAERQGSTRPTRSARTATSSSTRSRTSRRCS